MLTEPVYSKIVFEVTLTKDSEEKVKEFSFTNVTASTALSTLTAHLRRGYKGWQVKRQRVTEAKLK